MCFTILPESKLLTAKEDIICYKVLYYNENKLYSVYRNFRYKINKTYRIFRWLKSDNEKEQLEFFSVISRGFHSYIEIPRCYLENVVVECIIPKGSKYYQNYCEYVSNKIKIIKIIKDYVFLD
jgi:hypothetical protein